MVRKEFFMRSKRVSLWLNRIAAVLLLAAAVVIQPTHAGAPSSKGNSIQKVHKVMTNDLYLPMDINNIFNYYSNDGDGSFNPYKTDNEGFEFPIGSTVGTCIFEDGLVWTAFKNGTLYCGGSSYNHGLQAGRILQNGTLAAPPVADDPGQAGYRIYRIRPNIKPSTNATTQAAETALLQSSEIPYFNRSGVTSSETAIFSQNTQRIGRSGLPVKVLPTPTRMAFRISAAVILTTQRLVSLVSQVRIKRCGWL